MSEKSRVSKQNAAKIAERRLGKGLTSKSSLLRKKDVLPKASKEKKASVDPTSFARSLRAAYERMGDEAPSAEGSRPLDGVEGMDHTFDAFRRFYDGRDNDYYQSVSPFNYGEFLRMGGPQFVDAEGIMYRVADRRDFARYSLPDDNLLLRERIEPVGAAIVAEFKRTPDAKSGEILWMARPKGKTFPFPPRPEGASSEEVVFSDPRTGVPLMKGRVDSDSVFRQPGFAVGYVHVRRFEPYFPLSP